MWDWSDSRTASGTSDSCEQQAVAARHLGAVRLQICPVQSSTSAGWLVHVACPGSWQLPGWGVRARDKSWVPGFMVQCLGVVSISCMAFANLHVGCKWAQFSPCCCWSCVYLPARARVVMHVT